MDWKRILILLLLAGGLYWALRSGFIEATGIAGGPTATTSDDGARVIAAAFSAHRSGQNGEEAVSSRLPTSFAPPRSGLSEGHRRAQ